MHRDVAGVGTFREATDGGSRQFPRGSGRYDHRGRRADFDDGNPAPHRAGYPTVAVCDGRTGPTPTNPVNDTSALSHATRRHPAHGGHHARAQSLGDVHLRGHHQRDHQAHRLRFYVRGIADLAPPNQGTFDGLQGTRRHRRFNSLPRGMCVAALEQRMARSARYRDSGSSRFDTLRCLQTEATRISF